MDTERARELLPWLLNGSLEEPERGELIAALRGDRELRRELAETRAAGGIFAQHVSTEDLVAHAFGAPTGLAAERIEAHLALCERCSEELALVRESRSLEDGGETAAPPAPGTLPFRRPAPVSTPAVPRTGGAWRVVALAASLVAMVGFSGWLATWHGSQTRVADLAASLRGSVPPMPERAVPEGGALGLLTSEEILRSGDDDAPARRLAPAGPTAAHELTVYLPDEAVANAAQAVWELRLLSDADSGGERELVRARPAPVMPGDGHLLFRVPALPPGEHVAELRRLDPRRGWVTIERYPLSVG